MTTAPNFSSTANVSSALPTTADTNLATPTNFQTLWTPGASGGQVYSIIVQGIGSTVAGLLNIFRWDGTNFNLIDQVGIDLVTVNTTTPAFRQPRDYSSLLLATTDTLRVSQTIAGNASMLKVTAFGGNF